VDNITQYNTSRVGGARGAGRGGGGDKDGGGGKVLTLIRKADISPARRR